MKPVRGFALVVILVIIALLIGVGATLGYQKLTKKPQPSPIPTPSDQSVTSSSLSPTPVDETANWKTFENNKFSIKYPANWVMDNRYPDQHSIAFKSINYADDGGLPTITKGFLVYLYINMGFGKEESLGLVNSSETTWLSKKAHLERNTWEGAFVRLWTDDNADLNMVMPVPPGEKPIFKTFEENKKDFMAVANSLKLK